MRGYIDTGDTADTQRTITASTATRTTSHLQQCHRNTYDPPPCTIRTSAAAHKNTIRLQACKPASQQASKPHRCESESPQSESPTASCTPCNGLPPPLKCAPLPRGATPVQRRVTPADADLHTRMRPGAKLSHPQSQCPLEWGLLIQQMQRSATKIQLDLFGSQLHCSDA